eukprot:CAMPEP_0113892742 /NCGR_PEP_ID=MMETSP0780_2-20120614/15619_1 /TAXON_ID=652834 /ORGANISM="Palpitomonas bilix" /LENGTH=405 /DNA_ID=CAMNT_0000882781 /DNA_START=151 /DNA_END=1365 /DNA_ORIENTATION=- /assembly_acc=CAM_ASM_000599
MDSTVTIGEIKFPGHMLPALCKFSAGGKFDKEIALAECYHKHWFYLGEFGDCKKERKKIVSGMDKGGDLGAKGLMYHEGWGKKKDDNEAVKYWEQGAEQDQAFSQLLLAQWLLTNSEATASFGKTKEEKGRRARALLEQSVTHGCLPAYVELAICYRCDQQLERSFELLREAALRLWPQAIYHLAECFQQGWGVEKDDRIASYLFITAADLGCSDVSSDLRSLGMSYSGKSLDENFEVFWSTFEDNIQIIRPKSEEGTKRTSPNAEFVQGTRSQSLPSVEEQLEALQEESKNDKHEIKTLKQKLMLAELKERLLKSDFEKEIEQLDIQVSVVYEKGERPKLVRVNSATEEEEDSTEDQQGADLEQEVKTSSHVQEGSYVYAQIIMFFVFVLLLVTRALNEPSSSW